MRIDRQDVEKRLFSHVLFCFHYFDVRCKIIRKVLKALGAIRGSSSSFVGRFSQEEFKKLIIFMLIIKTTWFVRID